MTATTNISARATTLGILLAAGVVLGGCANIETPKELPAYVATSSTRTLAEIQYTFRKAAPDFTALFASLPRRRQKAGILVVGLTVAADGSVAECHLGTSTVDDALAHAALDKVRTLNFGARDVPAFTLPDYPIHFIPQ